MTDPFAPILHPSTLLSRPEVLAKPCPVPNAAGLYAWYFKQVPPGVPTADCRRHDGLTLLYAGIAPSGPASKSTLRKRTRIHYGGNASRSTLRRSLGCLLENELGIQLRFNPSGRVTFGKEGEARLSEWMAENAFVVWMEHDEPWVLEPELIQNVSLPLNIEHNERHRFPPVLAALRKEARERAKVLPVVDG